jgi:hypothetical protein
MKNENIGIAKDKRLHAERKLFRKRKNQIRKTCNDTVKSAGRKGGS